MAKPAQAKRAAIAGDPKALAEALTGRGIRQAANQAENDGRPLLVYAVAGRTGDASSAICVKALLAAGADPNAMDTRKQSALHWAARFSRPLCSAALIDGGADINATTNFGDRPLQLAIVGGSLLCVKYLADAGADLTTPDAKGLSPLEFCMKHLSTLVPGTPHHENTAAVYEYLSLCLSTSPGTQPVRRFSI